MSGQTLIIDLLRHGEPAGGQRFRGSIDDPLTECGWTQMRAATAGLGPWDRVLSSPSSRCRAFAEEVAEKHQLGLVLDARLAELHFGAWEGHPAAELPAADLERYWHNPLTFTPPGAETLADFNNRVLAAWSEHTAVGGRLLLISHGGTIRAILAAVLGMPVQHLLRLEVEHAAHCQVTIHHDGNGGRYQSLRVGNGSPAC